MMRSHDFQFMNRSMEETIGQAKLCVAVFVTSASCTQSGCGPSPFDNSAYNSSCAVCNGTGYVTSEQRYPFKCMVEWMTENMYAPWRTAGITLGDCYLSMTQQVHLLIARIADDDYILVDGVTVRITDQKQINAGAVAGEWLLTCHKVLV